MDFIIYVIIWIYICRKLRVRCSYYIFKTSTFCVQMTWHQQVPGHQQTQCWLIPATGKYRTDTKRFYSSTPQDVNGTANHGLRFKNGYRHACVYFSYKVLRKWVGLSPLWRYELHFVYSKANYILGDWGRTPTDCVTPSYPKPIKLLINPRYTVETLYNTVNFWWSTHKRHSIARPKGLGMGCLLRVQRATYCVDLSKLSSIKYLL